LSDVTLVIPGRNCAATIGPCLRSVVPLLQSAKLARVIFVDDASTDRTAQVVDDLIAELRQGTSADVAIDVLSGPGKGAGGARNIGWQAADTDLIWFVDSDCVVDPDALQILLQHLDADDVAAVGGSYGNMRPDSLVASLIHAEIVQRHRRMRLEVDFLATFNVVYRRRVLAQLGGFDERFVKAQDAELAYRARRAGHRLRFDARSQVRHFHADSLGHYLKVQRQQGYWRAWLYAVHPERISGDSYSGFADHVQPPLALAMVALSPTMLLGPLALIQAPLAGALLAAQWPMTSELVRSKRSLRYAAFAPMSFCRAFSRGIGFAHGTTTAAIAKLVGDAKSQP
jgi:glycosyltransferase involved in cell wall biosynthesis